MPYVTGKFAQISAGVYLYKSIKKGCVAQSEFKARKYETASHIMFACDDRILTATKT